MISNTQIAAIVCSLLISVAAPVVLLIVWRKKAKAVFSAAAVGAAIFLLFSMVLEQIPHYLLLQPDGFVMNHTWAYVLYGTLAAGIFEETGRFFGFRVLLKRHRGRETGVMYGIGHGGIESILLCGSIMVLYLVLALQINAGAALPDSLQPMASALPSMTAGGLLLYGYERLMAISFHIAVSVFVFEAADRPGHLWMYPIAIILHAGLDVGAALYQRGMIPMIASEVWITIVTLVVCIVAVRIYRGDQAEKEQTEVETSVESV
jgi:uncharacterized membrane protein YhfC